MELRNEIDSVLVRCGVNGIETARNTILDAVIAALPDDMPVYSDDVELHNFALGNNSAVKDIKARLQSAKEQI